MDGERQVFVSFLCITEGQFKAPKVIIKLKMLTLLGLLVFHNTLYNFSFIGEGES